MSLESMLTKLLWIFFFILAAVGIGLIVMRITGI